MSKTMFTVFHKNHLKRALRQTEAAQQLHSSQAEKHLQIQSIALIFCPKD